jgi:hypothetical protein
MVAQKAMITRVKPREEEVRWLGYQFFPQSRMSLRSMLCGAVSGWRINDLAA